MTNPSIAELAARVRATAPHAGDARVVLIDGPAGSGKTTLAGRLAEALGAQVLHGDDMYEGWGGLPTLHEVLIDRVLEPLARGDRAGFERWDWERGESGERAERIDVPPAPFVVIEGVGVAQRAARPYASLLIYVDAPWAMRIERGIARDGEAMRSEWERWHDAEDAHLSEHGTRAAAHVLIDGTAPVPDA